jgi:hypothetical protein
MANLSSSYQFMAAGDDNIDILGLVAVLSDRAAACVLVAAACSSIRRLYCLGKIMGIRK